MRNIFILSTIFALLTFHVHAEVLFVTEAPSDTVNHPKKLVPHAVFKVRLESPSPDSADSEVSVYIDHICKESSIWPARVCETFGPISLEKAKQFMLDNADMHERLLADLEAVDIIHGQFDGADKAGLQLLAMIPVAGFFWAASHAASHERMVKKFNTKYSAFMLVFATQGRNVYYFKNRYEDYYKLSERLRNEISQLQ